MRFKENEEAVSPVIGVILMVAITVILAAVIAAFVFGMTGGVETTKTVNVQSRLDGENITVTIGGGPDLGTLQSLTFTIAGEAPDEFYYNEDDLTTEASEAITPEGTKFNVGDTFKIQPNSGRLLVVGKWADGSEQIILDRTY